MDHRAVFHDRDAGGQGVLRADKRHIGKALRERRAIGRIGPLGDGEVEAVIALIRGRKIDRQRGARRQHGARGVLNRPEIGQRVGPRIGPLDRRHDVDGPALGDREIGSGIDDPEVGVGASRRNFRRRDERHAKVRGRLEIAGRLRQTVRSARTSLGVEPDE